MQNNRFKAAIFSLLFSFFVIVNQVFAISFVDINIDKKLQHADDIRSSNPKLFNQILEDLTKNKENASPAQRYYLSYLLAYQQTYSGQLKESLDTYNNILNSDASSELKFRANSTIINILAITQDWTQGLEHLADNLKMLDLISNKEIKQKGLNISALFYNLLGQYELGYRYSTMAQVSTKNPRIFCAASQLAIEAKFKLRQINVDDLRINQAIDACVQANEIIFTSAIRTYLAKLHMDNGNSQKAKKLLLETVSAIEVTKYAPVIAAYYSLLAEAYFDESDFVKSSWYANKTLAKTGGSGNSKPLVSAYLLLYKIHLKDKAYQEALSYYVKYSEANNAHLEGEKAKHLAFQLAKHQAFEQESQIKLLNEQNNALAAEQALAKTQANNRKLIILSLGLIIIVFAFLGMRFWRTHKRVRQLAEYDPLTGIYNRGHFAQVTNSALKYCQNAKQDLSLIMFDLDHFKKVNDIFGHACGDWALKETIKACKGIGRQNDIFARLGGEEFCLVLPSCNIDTAMLRAEACRAAIEAIITEESGHDFSITASFGVTDVKRSGFTLDKLLADADMAAYTSKNAGRNRITLFEIPQTEKPKKLDNSWDYET